MTDENQTQMSGAMDEMMFAPVSLHERIKFLAQDVYAQAVENLRERLTSKQDTGSTPPADE